MNKRAASISINEIAEAHVEFEELKPMVMTITNRMDETIKEQTANAYERPRCYDSRKAAQKTET